MANTAKIARNYLIRFALAVVVYTTTVLVALPAARRMEDGPLRYLVACLPVSGVGLGIWALWAILREIDEMQSRKLLDALTFSLALTIVITFGYGMMQSVGMPTANWTWMIGLWGVSFGIGILIASWRYR